jgi:hypothetical protein
MGEFINVPIVNGKALQGRKYVLFRPERQGEEQGWRKRFMMEGRKELGPGHSVYTRELPVPAFLPSLF